MKAVLAAAVALICRTAAESAPQAPPISFGDAAERWLTEGRTRSTSATRRDYEATLATPNRTPRLRGHSPGLAPNMQ